VQRRPEVPLRPPDETRPAMEHRAPARRIRPLDHAIRAAVRHRTHSAPGLARVTGTARYPVWGWRDAAKTMRRMRRRDSRSASGTGASSSRSDRGAAAAAGRHRAGGLRFRLAVGNQAGQLVLGARVRARLPDLTRPGPAVHAAGRGGHGGRRRHRRRAGLGRAQHLAADRRLPRPGRAGHDRDRPGARGAGRGPRGRAGDGGAQRGVLARVRGGRRAVDRVGPGGVHRPGHPRPGARSQ
jgi:hypothetical protein